MRRFAMTIFTATQHCCDVMFQIVTTLLQHCSNIAMLCCAENRHCESSDSCNITFKVAHNGISIVMACSI